MRDAQRTKTDASTRRTLSIVWGATSLETRLEQATSWYRELLAEAGAATAAVTTEIR